MLPLSNSAEKSGAVSPTLTSVVFSCVYFSSLIQLVEARRLIAREKNIALAVMTADCLPVLLRSIDGDVVAAVHCGWKGLASNVLENTILAMNCERNKIMAWLGPCIGEKCFEVGKEVKQIFEDKNLALGQFFKQTDEVHYLADLKGIAKFILNQLNVYNVSVNEECTYSNVDKYYSYKKKKITGRMAGVIWKQKKKSSLNLELFKLLSMYVYSRG